MIRICLKADLPPYYKKGDVEFFREDKAMALFDAGKAERYDPAKHGRVSTPSVMERVGHDTSIKAPVTK
jgi:hypothetical protein